MPAGRAADRAGARRVGLTIVVGTPRAGLAFELPGGGRLAFAGIGALSLAALAALAQARTL